MADEELELIKIIDLDPVTEFLPGLLTIVSDTLGNTKKTTIGQLREWITNAPLIVNGSGTTPPIGSNSNDLATTKFVQDTISGLGLGIASSTAYGTVRTDVTDPVPVVYLKSQIDGFNNAVRSVATGGTGGNTQPTARSGIGAAVSGINNDITQLTALTDVPGLIQAAINALFKPGFVIATAGNTIPAGWLRCDGQAVSRATYAALFAEIGTIYGTGNGSTSFNLPQNNGRAIVGSGTSSEGVFNTLGDKYGSSNATLSIANLPSHNHGGSTNATDRSIDHLHTAATSSDGFHGHSNNALNSAVASAGGGATKLSTGGSNALNIDGAGTHTHSVFIFGADRSLDHLHGIPAQGSGSAFSIVDPRIVMNILIKT